LSFHAGGLAGGQALAFFVRGVAIIDGLSNTVLVSEGFASVTCGDPDLDGRLGIVQLQFQMRDVKTGALVPVLIVPDDGELDDGGVQNVTLVIGSQTIPAIVQVNAAGNTPREG
jgi:hypothetical protein